MSSFKRTASNSRIACLTYLAIFGFALALPEASHAQDGMKPLSAQLAELSVRAAAAEERVKALESSEKEKLDAKLAELKSAANATENKINKSIAATKDDVSSAWAKFVASAKSREESVEASILSKKEAVERTLAEKRAEYLERHAAISVEYALQAIDAAALATANAIDARMTADALK